MKLESAQKSCHQREKRSVKRLLYKFLLEKLFRLAVYVQLAFF
jgi:hypothetical protein